MTPQNTPRYRRAVVFAYHNVGLRCLQVLLAQGVEVLLVVTHQDDPRENRWFGSVAALCAERGLPCIMPDKPDQALYEQVAALAPDMIFSFYYRHMLAPELLALAPGGAWNMHGSLLPKYRGRVPVNWAVLHGETETGMSLHAMHAKPDAGPLAGQVSVPILPDDTAFEVFGKLTVAAEQLLWRELPYLCAGSPRLCDNPIAQGSYFGGRTPEMGRIDWRLPAQAVYNLHRAVAPPYPGAFCQLGPQRLILQSARLLPPSQAQHPELCQYLSCGLHVRANQIYGVCGDGGALLIHSLHDAQGAAVSAAQLAAWLVHYPQGPVD
ncbi:formyltransferase [Massilia sp. W12]|uniref:formyltransferase n=1 Tax=Massilia sp. W12 TaxID=3126507 RepID=UPI0030CF5485